jgi:fatty acid desaturase
MRKRKQKTVKAEDQRKTLMEWTVHLARRQPFKAAIVVLVIALTLAVGWLWVHPLIAFLMGSVPAQRCRRIFVPAPFQGDEGRR